MGVNVHSDLLRDMSCSPTCRGCFKLEEKQFLMDTLCIRSWYTKNKLVHIITNIQGLGAEILTLTFRVELIENKCSNWSLGIVTSPPFYAITTDLTTIQ